MVWGQEWDIRILCNNTKGSLRGTEAVGTTLLKALPQASLPSVSKDELIEINK